MNGLLLPLSLRFLWMFLALTIGLGLLTSILGISNAGTSLIPFWAAALDLGTRFHHRTDRRPNSGEAWTLAGMCTFVAVAISAPFVYLYFAGDPDGLPEGATRILSAVVIVLIAVLFLLARAFVWLGGRSAMKAAEKKAAKEADEAVQRF
ncbi:MAG: ABZJ_00895 family protein [Pseudomonadota bacterium]